MRTTNALLGFFTHVCLLAALLLLPSVQASTVASMDISQELHTDDFEQILKRRTLRILVVYSPTFYFIDKGQPKGLTYEAMESFVKQLNQKHHTGKLPIKAMFIPVHRDELIPALQAGRGDIAAANLTITPERSKQVAFSKPFADQVHEVLVQGSAAKPITSVQGLSGASVYVRKSSSYYESLQNLNQQLRQQGLAEVHVHLAPDALEDEDLLQFANSGLIDNLVVDQHKARLWEKILPNIHVRHAVAVRENGQIAWMLRQSNPQLKAEIDAHISHELGKNQKDHNWRLIKYLKHAAYLNNTQSAQARARFSKTVELFKHYSAQYDADFILMIAQGYQESRLNQAARSPVGAIGIMQLMPATGKEMGVGDIHELSANIHAGVKYIQKIRNSYFADPAIDDLNRHLLSFAAYNAGPNRINKLRKVAAQRGLDPNIWHNNVERVVAEKVGREPVNYVANIYAYYVAYTLAMQQGNDRAEAREHFTPQAQ